MKVYAFFVSIIIGLFIFTNHSYSFELQPKSWCAAQKGPTMLKDNRGYSLHDYTAVNSDKIRFLTHWFGPVNWEDRLEIDRNVKEMVSQKSGCHVREQWRWETLPEDHPAVVILAWHNRDSHGYGWCAVKNTDDYWYLSTDYQSWTIVRQEYSTFNWDSRGTKIFITFRNPENVKGWTGHDFWYLFRYQ